MIVEHTHGGGDGHAHDHGGHGHSHSHKEKKGKDEKEKSPEEKLDEALLAQARLSDDHMDSNGSTSKAVEIVKDIPEPRIGT